MLRENGYLPLPSIPTVNRAIKAMHPQFGFDKALAAGLTDEIQISKNVDFRVDTGKMVEFVDFGNNTTEE